MLMEDLVAGLMNALPNNPLGLHHLTVMDVSAPDLVDLAARLGLHHVSVFIRAIRPGDTMFPVIEDPAMLRDVAARLKANDVQVHNLEIFPINPKTKPEFFREGLERGAQLGAKRLTSAIADADTARARDNFASLCAMAAEYDIDVHIEFTGFSVVKSLADARAFLEGHRPANATIAIDALHLYRNDGGIDGLKTCPPDLIGYAQINDGKRAAPPDMDAAFHEAIIERGMPGTGEFDLKGLIDALPSGIVIDIEAPSKSMMNAGMGPEQRARAMIEASRAIGGARIVF